MVGSPVIGDVWTWTEIWKAGNIHLLWRSASPLLSNHRSGSFSILTDEVAGACELRSALVRRMWVGNCANEGEGGRHRGRSQCPLGMNLDSGSDFGGVEEVSA